MGKNKEFKVTYTTLDPSGLEAFHEKYDQAVQNVRSRLGQSYPIYIAGKKNTGFEEFKDISPTNTEIVVGHFQKGTADVLIEAVDAAHGAFKAWRELEPTVSALKSLEGPQILSARENTS